MHNADPFHGVWKGFYVRQRLFHGAGNLVCHIFNLLPVLGRGNVQATWLQFFCSFFWLLDPVKGSLSVYFIHPVDTLMGCEVKVASDTSKFILVSPFPIMQLLRCWLQIVTSDAVSLLCRSSLFGHTRALPIICDWLALLRVLLIVNKVTLAPAVATDVVRDLI